MRKIESVRRFNTQQQQKENEQKSMQFSMSHSEFGVGFSFFALNSILKMSQTKPTNNNGMKISEKKSEVKKKKKNN